MWGTVRTTLKRTVYRGIVEISVGLLNSEFRPVEGWTIVNLSGLTKGRWFGAKDTQTDKLISRRVRLKSVFRQTLRSYHLVISYTYLVSLPVWVLPRS